MDDWRAAGGIAYVILNGLQWKDAASDLSAKLRQRKSRYSAPQVP